jgi:hypothetical protein
MAELPTPNLVEYLVSRRFPAASALRRSPPSLTRPPRSGEIPIIEARKKLLAQVDAYEAELKSKTAAELQALYEQDLMAKAEREERERFFNQLHANADFAHWSKATYWTLDEATALSFGKAPEVVNWENLKPYVSSSPFAQRYARLRDLAFRAENFGQLYDPVLPGIYIAWAKRNQIDFPADLEAAIHARGIQVADWKSMYDEVEAALDKAKQEQGAALRIIDDLKTRVESLVSNNEELARAVNEVIAERDAAKAKVVQLQSEPEAAKTAAKGLEARERESLLRLVIGMAVEAYRYDPKQKRSDKISEIASDLEKAGVVLDVDTVRKWLREAGELLPPRETD